MKSLFSLDMIPHNKIYSFITLFSVERLFAVPRFISVLVLLIVSIFTLSSQVNAVEINDLYQAKIKVTSQNSAQKTVALKKAMESVLVKVGGDNVSDNKFVKQAIKQNSRYLLQFSYAHELVTSSSAVIPNNTVPEEQLFLHALFSEEKVNQLLVKANIPIWGRLRPQVLLWFVEEDGFNRRILSDASSSHYPSLVYQHTQQRGLPLLLPLMDITDLTQVNTADVWGRFIVPLQPIAKRYSAEASVIIRLSNSSLLDESTVDCQPLCKTTEHVLDWTLFLANAEYNEKYKGPSADKLLVKALTEITNVIYENYALVNESSGDDNFYIEVANVDSMATYVNIIQFIEELSAVQSVTLVNAEGENRRFSLQLLSSPEAFLSSLKLNDELRIYVDPLGAVDTEAIPIFYWGSAGPQPDHNLNLESMSFFEGKKVTFSKGENINHVLSGGLQ